MLGIAAAVLFWQADRSDPSTILPDDVHSDVSPEADAARASSQFAGASPAGFAMDRSSLRGTHVDGGVSFDESGRVVVDLALRRLFDYYLSLIGERDLAQIRQLLTGYLLERYGPQPAATVLNYFDRYAGYLQRLAESGISQSLDPQDRLVKVTALRRQLLGDEMASKFFADEAALAALTLKRMTIAADNSLTADQKSQRLAELDRNEGDTARAEADTASVVAHQDRRFDQTNASPSQRVVEREALWGKQAAQRLGQLDAARLEWDTRVEQYLFARSRIDADRSLSPAARAQALAALRAQRFDTTEQRRIASLEAIGQLKPGG